MSNNPKMSYWVIPWLLLSVLAGVFLKDTADELVKYLGIDRPDELTAIIVCLIAGIFPCVLICRRINGSSVLSSGRRCTAHLLIAVLNFLVFFPVLTFIGIIAFNYFESDGSRYSTGAVPWVVIGGLFWSLKVTISEYWECSRKIKQSI